MNTIHANQSNQTTKKTVRELAEILKLYLLNAKRLRNVLEESRFRAEHLPFLNERCKGNAWPISLQLGWRGR